jgi:hypothetical protein
LLNTDLFGEMALQKVFLLGAIALAGTCPATAQANTWRITCETVRAFVAAVGPAQARAAALAHGMTPSQERRARHCLEEGS